jgi:hypothetical protein
MFIWEISQILQHVCYNNIVVCVVSFFNIFRTHFLKCNYRFETYNLMGRCENCRSQGPRSLMRRSSAARLLRLWVRIPPGLWMFVCCECCVLSGRGLWDGLITRPEESCRLWRVEEAKARYRAVKIQAQWVVTPRQEATNKQMSILVPVVSWPLVFVTDFPVAWRG